MKPLKELIPLEKRNILRGYPADDSQIPEERKVIIWSGFKWILEEGETVEDLLEAYDLGTIMAEDEIRRITDLKGNILKEEEI